MKSELTYFISGILNKAIPFLLIPYITFRINPEGFAKIALIFTIATITSAIILAGQNTSYLVRASKNKNLNGKLIKFKATIIVLVINFIVLTLLTIIIIMLFDISKEMIEYTWWGLMLGMGSALMAMPLVFFQTNLNAYKYGIINTLTTIFNVAASYLFIEFYNLDWVGRLSGAFISYLIPIIFIIILIKNSPSIDFVRIKSNVLITSRIGFPLIPHTLSGALIYGIDRIILVGHESEATIGVYSFAYQFSLVVSLIGSSINTAVSPRLIKMIQLGNNGDAYALVANRAMYSLAGTFLALVASVGIVLIVIPSTYRESIYYMPILFFAYYFEGLYSLFLNWLYAKKLALVISKITFIGMIFNLVLCFILIPYGGAYAAAFITLITYIIMLLILTIYIRHQNNILKCN